MIWSNDYKLTDTFFSRPHDAEKHDEEDTSSTKYSLISALNLSLSLNDMLAGSLLALEFFYAYLFPFC